MDLAIKLIVLLPLLAAAIAGLFCRVIGDRPAQIVTCAALLIAAALSVLVFVRIGFGPDKLLVVHCKGGYRSSIATSILRRAGFRDIANLTGGFDAWKAAELARVS